MYTRIVPEEELLINDSYSKISAKIFVERFHKLTLSVCEKMFPAHPRSNNLLVNGSFNLTLR